MKKLGRFLLVGGLCTLLGMLVIWVMTGLFSIHYLISTFAVFVAINPIGYALNRQFTYGDDSPRWTLQLMRYYAVTAGSLVLTLVLSAVLVDGLHMHYLTANGLIAITMVSFNYLGHGGWTFRPTRRTERGVR